MLTCATSDRSDWVACPAECRMELGLNHDNLTVHTLQSCRALSHAAFGLVNFLGSANSPWLRRACHVVRLCAFALQVRTQEAVMQKGGIVVPRGSARISLQIHKLIKFWWDCIAWKIWELTFSSLACDHPSEKGSKSRLLQPLPHVWNQLY